MAEKEETEDYSEYVKKYQWMIRPCSDYKAEAKECKLFRSRFHQYFIHGTFTDCTTFAKDVQNCEKCVSEKNDLSCRDVIKNEAQRRLKRYEGHIKNDVWEKRSGPPDNWNEKLPDWWLKQNDASLFKESDQEFREYIACNEPNKPHALCVIL